MTTITTREARAGDAPVIIEMIKDLSKHHQDVAQIDVEELIFLCFGPTPWVRLIVAEKGRLIVGYAALQKKVQLQFARRLMDVQHVFVAEQMRGQGVGRALIASAQEHAVLARCSGLTLGVSPQNQSAHAFYTALGFEPRETGGARQLMRKLPLHGGQVAS